MNRLGPPRATGAVGVIGVIGGMGPLATADFFRKVVENTTADSDDQHVPLLISSDPRIPSRPAAILAGGESPLPALLALRNRLLAAGVSALVMPCNTAHHWHAQLSCDAGVPFPSIVQCSTDEALARTGAGARIAVLATRATLAARLFDAPLAAHGCHAVMPSDALLDGFILPSIAAVKAGRLADAQSKMQHAVHTLLQVGADAVLLACTEAPIALQGAPQTLHTRCIDTTLVLAQTTVKLWAQLQRSTSDTTHANANH
jgi:aspartate racemase